MGKGSHESGQFRAHRSKRRQLFIDQFEALVSHCHDLSNRGGLHFYGSPVFGHALVQIQQMLDFTERETQALA